jgi:hypothetical protein
VRRFGDVLYYLHSTGVRIARRDRDGRRIFLRVDILHTSLLVFLLHRRWRNGRIVKGPDFVLMLR